ncbi:nucleoid occlusion protein [Clostridium senegalense]|uniref:nucleoid occlusion protein n=1 Tax=Clostridium senegalense TaxID=1465809 RepID=UPI000287ECBE|nr:nucleoid occlusion protein [Clostridium senegalense]
MEKNVINVSTELIMPNKYQPRQVFNEEAIEELAQSIKTYGIIQPLTVRKSFNDTYELIAGERRLRAAKHAGLLEVPVIIVEINDKESAAIALLENLQREDLNFFEEAVAYYNLIQEHEYTQDQLAKAIGKKQSTIANKLRILKLDKELIDLIIENKLTERHARALLKLPTLELQKSVINEVINKGLNVSKTEQLIDRELLRISHQEIAADGKKRIKGVFNSKIYVNTIKQVFDKYGIKANYRSKELDDSIQVTITIKKK